MPSIREIVLQYWMEHNDDFCGGILDDRYSDWVSTNYPEYAANTPGVELGEPGTDEYDQAVMDGCDGVGQAFVFYLAKGCDVPWLIEQLTKHLKERENAGSRAGGDISTD